MHLGMGLGLRQELSQQIIVELPSTNWSLIDAYTRGGNQPLKFQKKQLDVSRMSLEQRLAAVDKANEVFRFVYARGEDVNAGKWVDYFKIPVFRDLTIDIDDVKMEISKKQYDRATAILEGAGSFQRIARAIHYSQLHKDIKEFVASQGYSLDDVVIVGVDRGGRLPSFIAREALGKKESYTLKVNQGGFNNGSLDDDKLRWFIENNTFKDKFVLFVDSTVDSGRQIAILRRYFDDDSGWKLGHKSWGIVGSNDCGQNLYKHKNINWGVDPDKTFEDNPQLMGVDYAPGSNTKTVECPSKTSEEIKEALLEVPKGVVLDFSSLEELIKTNKQFEKAADKIQKILYSRTWFKCVDLYKSSAKKDLGVTTIPIPNASTQVAQKKRLLVIGTGSRTDLSNDELNYIVQSLSQTYDIIVGAPSGNPGKIIKEFNKTRKGSAQLRQPEYQKNTFENDEAFGNKIAFAGETKDEFREKLVQSADGVLALGGEDGTLQETILALNCKKPVYVISGYGAVGIYAKQSASLRKNKNLHMSETLPELVEQLQGECR